MGRTLCQIRLNRSEHRQRVGFSYLGIGDPEPGIDLGFGPTRSLAMLGTAAVPDAEGNASGVRNGMICVPGGTFRMGSDRHYPEEAPVHRVTVDPFWIDQTPVTNRQFKEFVRATGYKTFAEIPPDPKDYPGTLPHMVYAGSLVFHA